MKRTKIVVLVIGLICAAFIGWIVYEVATDPMNELYKDRIEYPLASVDINDHSEYMLVKWQHSPAETYEVITDTQAIKDNASAFTVDNDGSIYGTTPDGLFSLYRDGKYLNTVAFDNTYTKNIEYGTLEFRRVNQLQYELLVGAEFVERRENDSILCSTQSEKPYYYCFAHGDDLEDVDSVYLLDSGNSIGPLPKPKRINEDILEFTQYSTNDTDQQTRHCYFRLSDCKVSRWYWNVKAIKENIIVYPASYMQGGKSRMILHDMFDPSLDFQEVFADFPKPRDDHFLLSAGFLANGNLIAEYIGEDGQVHQNTFSLGSDD